MISFEAGPSLRALGIVLNVVINESSEYQLWKVCVLAISRGKSHWCDVISYLIYREIVDFSRPLLSSFFARRMEENMLWAD